MVLDCREEEGKKEVGGHSVVRSGRDVPDPTGHTPMRRQLIAGTHVAQRAACTFYTKLLTLI
jgi:hypothetical protein